MKKLIFGAVLVVAVVVILNVNFTVDSRNIDGIYTAASDIIILRKNGTHSQMVKVTDEHPQLEKNSDGIWRFYRSSDERPTVTCGYGNKIFMSNFISYDYFQREFRASGVCLSIEEHLLRTELIYGDIIYVKEHW